MRLQRRAFGSGRRRSRVALGEAGEAEGIKIHDRALAQGELRPDLAGGRKPWPDKPVVCKFCDVRFATAMYASLSLCLVFFGTIAFCIFFPDVVL